MRTTTNINAFDLVKIISKEVDKTRLDLASGNCTSYDDYRYLVGYHTGLVKLEQIVNDLEATYLNDEDD
jgi:hypothetical protein